MEELERKKKNFKKAVLEKAKNLHSLRSSRTNSLSKVYFYLIIYSPKNLFQAMH